VAEKTNYALSLCIGKEHKKQQRQPGPFPLPIRTSQGMTLILQVSN